MLLTVDLLERLIDVLPTSAAYVLIYLHTEKTERKQEAFTITQSKVAVTAGLTQSSCRRALCRLEKAGFIKFKRDGDRTIFHIYDIYTILPNLSTTRIPTEFQPNSNRIPTEFQPNIVKPSEKSPEIDLLQEFEAVWKLYPRRMGKKGAWNHFKASVKSRADIADIHRALNNYLADIAKNATEPQFIQHGDTWFNNWRDWINPVVEMPKSVSSVPRLPKVEPPPPEPTMTMEEMRAIAQANLKKNPADDLPDTGEAIPAGDINELVIKLAGGRPK